MRRTKAEKEMMKINDFTPLIFERKCMVCKDYVRNEKIWRRLYFTDSWGDFYPHFNYVCTKCCPERKDAYKHLG